MARRLGCLQEWGETDKELRKFCQKKARAVSVTCSQQGITKIDPEEKGRGKKPGDAQNVRRRTPAHLLSVEGRGENWESRQKGALTNKEQEKRTLVLLRV